MIYKINLSNIFYLLSIYNLFTNVLSTYQGFIYHSNSIYQSIIYLSTYYLIPIYLSISINYLNKSRLFHFIYINMQVSIYQYNMYLPFHLSIYYISTIPSINLLSIYLYNKTYLPLSIYYISSIYLYKTYLCIHRGRIR